MPAIGVRERPWPASGNGLGRRRETAVAGLRQAKKVRRAFEPRKLRPRSDRRGGEGVAG